VTTQASGAPANPNIVVIDGQPCCWNCHQPVALSPDGYCTDCLGELEAPSDGSDLVCAAGFSCDPEECPGHGREDYSLE